MGTTGNKLRVVIAEDSEVDAHLAARALKRHGILANVVVASSEAEFSDALRGAVPDIIISDNSMPRFSGRRALEIATELAPGTPFIFLSGSVRDRVGGCEHLGRATACLDKRDLDQLGALVARLL